MALLNYSDLKTSIGNWLNRRDLTSVIPDFVTLAEDEIKRKVRGKPKRLSTFALDAYAVTLPADCSEVRGIRITSPPGYKPVKIVTQLVFDEKTAMNAGRTGVPQFACIVDRELLLSPVPAQAYTAELKYREKLIPLSANADSNSVLTDSKDVYLYGSLLQAAPFLKNDERVLLWQSKFDSAIEQINIMHEREEFPTGTAARLLRVFG